MIRQHSVEIRSIRWNISGLSGARPRFGSKKRAVASVRGVLTLGVLSALLLFAARPARCQTETVLYNFTGGSDGGSPASSLTYRDGNLYGTTFFGGVGYLGLGSGTVFELSPNGRGDWNEVVLYNFCSQGGANCTDGAFPNGPVVFDNMGNLYGIAPEGGNVLNCPFSVGCGVAFELSPQGAGWTETVVHAFCSQFSGDVCHDGTYPGGVLLIDQAGNLYGQVAAGVFELSPSSGGWSDEFISFNIENSRSGLTMDANGNIFGDAEQASTGKEVVFELSPNSSGDWTTNPLYIFANSPGVVVWGRPVLDLAGNIYAARVSTCTSHTFEHVCTQEIVYKLTPASPEWTRTNLYVSPQIETEVGSAYAYTGSLTLDAAGNVYGTTLLGGTNNLGSVFELAAPAAGEAYTEKTLWNFSGTDGSEPGSSVILDNDGNLYGTASGGGSGGNGVVFEVSPERSTTTITLTSSANPSTSGQAVTLTASVNSSAGAPPNGETVTFNNGSVVLGTASLGAGAASLTTSSLPTGIDTITATYSGDSTFASGMSPTLRQVVNSTKKSATATALVSNLNPSTYGQPVTWSATVTTSGSVVPTGNVTFMWSSSAIGTATLNASGVATLTRSNLNADAYPLTAVYKGDAYNLGSMSPIVDQVIQQTTSSATLTSSPNPSTPGEAVTFTAKISSPTVKATGPVSFTAGKTVLGTVELSNGKATFTTSTLATGSTTVTVTFDGDSNIPGSSASVTQVVQQSIGSGTSSTALSYTENPSTLAEAFTATATSSSGTPSGTMTFSVGSTTLGTVALTGGIATFNTTTLSVGSNTVMATYSGNSQIETSSAWVTQTFVMPVSGALYLQQEGGSAGGATTFGLGTSSANFVPYYTGLPNNPSPTGQLLVGTFPAGTLINFGMYTTFGSQSGYAFSTGTDQASLVSFADLSNSLGMDHGITQQTSPTTWLLHLDDALSYLFDDDNNDVLMELIVAPN